MSFDHLRLALCAALLALGPARAADLRIGMSADVTSIDPHFVNITPNNNVAWHIFEALTHVDENARLIPGLAESWRAVDPTTWEFKLRKGVRFHDGAELTAEDVAFSIERPATLTTSPGPFTTFTRPIVAKQIVDSHTIRLKTATPYAMVPYDMNSVFIVSKKAAAGASTEDFNSGKAAVGTRAVPARSLRARRSRRARPPRRLPRGEARLGQGDLPDRPERRRARDGAPRGRPRRDRVRADRGSQAGALDAAVPPRAEGVLAHDLLHARPASARSAPGVTDKGGQPLARNPFADPRVRQAIAKAINRQAIVDRVMDGAAVPASNLVAPPVFGHAADLKPDAYDVEGARKLLAEAGFSGGFTTVLAAPNNRYLNDEQIAQAVAQMLARIGIEAKVQTMPLAAYFPKARNQEFPVAMLGWGSFSGDLALRSLALTYDAERGARRLELGALRQPEGRPAGRRRPSRPWTSASAKRSRRRRCGSRWPTGRSSSCITRSRPGRCGATSPTPRARTNTLSRSTSASTNDRFRLARPRCSSTSSAAACRASSCCFVMSLLVFVGVYAIGNPIDILINPQADQMDRERAIAALGLDKPLWEQYSMFLERRADAATSASSFVHATSGARAHPRAHAGDDGARAHRDADRDRARHPARAVGRAASPTASPARTIMAGSILGFSLPTFWVGLMLIMVFSVMLGWLPSNGRGPTIDRVRHPGVVPHRGTACSTWSCRRRTSRCSSSRCSSASRAPARARRCCRTT